MLKNTLPFKIFYGYSSEYQRKIQKNFVFLQKISRTDKKLKVND